MNTIMFDTHNYVKKLKAVGVPEEQAEVHVDAIAGLIEEQLASKRDLKELEERLAYKLTLRLGSMLVVAISIVAALVKIG